MLMLWSDISIGDKIKFTKRCIDYYLINHYEWAKNVEDKVFEVTGVAPTYPTTTGLRIYIDNWTLNYIEILIDSGIGIGWSFNEQLIEVVELGSS